MKSIIRDYNPNKPLEVYRNLNSGLLSVSQDGLIVFYTDEIQLKDVKLVVRESGRKRVLIEKRKNVHAFLKGYINETDVSFSPNNTLYYNPYKTEKFVNEQNESIKEVEFVKVDSNGLMFYCGDILKW